MTVNLIIKPTIAVTESITPSARGWNKASKPHFYFWLFAIISCVGFWVPIRNLIDFSLSHDYGSHIFLIAPLSIFLVYLKRHEIFSNLQARLSLTTIIAGSSFLLLGLSVVLASKYQPFRAG